jgi:hypothetical protein
MNDEISRLLLAARPPEFEAGTPVDEATRKRELAKAFASFVAADSDVGLARSRRRLVAMRAAAAAVAAACLATVGVWAGVRTANVRPGHPGPPKPGRTVAARPIGLLDAPVATPMSVAAAQAGMPPYYVVADHLQPVAEVRSSATGKVLNVVGLPAAADPKLTHIAATGDGRTFVLALATFPSTSFYLLRLGDHGLSAQLTQLPVPAQAADKFVMAIAMSQDRTRLAIAIQFTGAQHGAIEVVTLRTGAVRTWTTRRTGLVTQLSWADHGRELGFFWQDTSATDTAGGLWMLDTSAPGSNLLSGRRILPDSVGDDTVQSALLSPDGNSIDASVTYSGTDQVSRGTVVGGIVEVSARTGRPLRTLLAEHAARSGDPQSPGWYITPCQLLSSDPTGNHLLVSCDRFGRLDRVRFTALPGSPPQTYVSTAW